MTEPLKDRFSTLVTAERFLYEAMNAIVRCRRTGVDSPGLMITDRRGSSGSDPDSLEALRAAHVKVAREACMKALEYLVLAPVEEKPVERLAETLPYPPE